MVRKPPDTLEIKGFGSDVNIILGNEAPFSDVEAELIKRLEGSNQLLSGVEVVLDTSDRMLSVQQFEKLKEILNDRFNLIISTVRSGSDETRKAAEEVGWKVQPQQQEQEEDIRSRRTPIRKRNNALLYKDKLRSGQRLEHRGNIVIIGDVNPGAEVVATGDVVVIGTLRGVAHAGAEGDISAEITALDLRPTQLRIAGYIGRSPDLDLEKDNTPEIARVEDGNIIIHKFKGK